LTEAGPAGSVPTVACVLVHTDVVDGHPTPAALAILGEGRRIASALGASLYAVAFTPEDDPAVEAALNAALGQGGADRSVVIAGAAPAALWLTRGPALARACELLRPSLVLLAADPAGRDIGPRLAARLGAAFIAEPIVEAGPRGEIVFARPVYDGELWRRLQLDELEQPAVVTLSADRPAARGTDDAELVRLAVVPRRWRPASSCRSSRPRPIRWSRPGSSWSPAPGSRRRPCPWS
jgi:electron transfer flavoprotein alpha subunit